MLPSPALNPPRACKATGRTQPAGNTGGRSQARPVEWIDAGVSEQGTGGQGNSS